MPNPVTQAILKNIDDPKLAGFIATWDALEELVISVYRSRAVEPAANQEFARLRSQLIHIYPEWQGELEPFWRKSRIKDRTTIDDPFTVVLQVTEAVALIGNWTVMKHLPAAREALNQLLLSRAEN